MKASLLSAALAAAERGWRVHPLQPGTKVPAVKDWPNRATIDSIRIERCWSAGAYNVGVATGPSSLLVVDLDVPKTDEIPPAEWQLSGVTCGADVLAVLAERAGEPAPWDTYTVRTPSGGTHLYFSVSEANLTNSAGRLGWRIDTRGVGGYVVGAGSVIGDHSYVVDPDLPVRPLPAWIEQLLVAAKKPAPVSANMTDLYAEVRRRSSYAAGALRDEVENVLSARSHRNDALNSAAFSLGQLVASGLLPQALVEDALTRAGEAVGLHEDDPPRQVENAIRSGMTAGLREPRRVPA
jgi:hypothetical protein